jgi:hypothetical protein
MRRVKQAVPLDECKRRALAFMRNLRKRHAGYPCEFVKASQVAYAIWPDATFTAQGAGAAASRILKHLERDGLVRWDSDGEDWGWKAVPR